MAWLRTCLALAITATAARAGDWPQWLGPNRDGSSAEKVAPWKEAPKRLWSANVGEGHSSPIIANGKVYLHARVTGKSEEVLTAYDAVSGKRLWSKSFPRADFNNPYGNGPRATPCVANGKVYTYGVTGVLSCFHADSGELLWQVDTLDKFKAPNLFFGVSSSPLVDENKLLAMVGKGATVVAFGLEKGDVLWKSLSDPASYAAPMVLGQGKERQAVFLTQQGVVSLNPADGSVFWKSPLVDALNESSTTPVRIGDLLLASSVTFGSVGLRLSAKEGKPSAEEAWKNPALTCYFATPVAVGTEHIYMVTGKIFPPPPQARLVCVEAKTGKELWQRDRVGKYHASLLRTGNNRLLMLDDAGNLILLEPDPKEYKELARAKVCGETWAHPALSNGKLYVRDKNELICLSLGE